jgi:hypothetical protein
MERTKVTRRATRWSAVALAALIGPGIALADQVSPEFGGRGGHRHGPGLSLQGRALAQTGEHQGSGIAVRASSGKEGEARGIVRFGTQTADNVTGFQGYVRCLSRDAAGVVQLTGTIQRSGSQERRQPDADSAQPSDSADPTAFLDELLGPDQGAGSDEGDGKDDRRFGGGRGELAGKDFAITIDVPGDPQRFTAAKVGDAGTLAACSAGDGAGLAVTRGGFRTTITEGR